MEEQLLIDFGNSGGAGGLRVKSKQYKETTDIVTRQLECVRDELRCRRLMDSARDGRVIVALDKLRTILAEERKGY